LLASFHALVKPSYCLPRTFSNSYLLSGWRPTYVSMKLQIPMVHLSMHRMSISRIICLSKPHNKIHTPYTSSLRSRLLWPTPAGIQRRTPLWRVDVLCAAPSAIGNMTIRKAGKQARSRDDNNVILYNFQSTASHECLSLHNRSLVRPTPRGILSTFANFAILDPPIRTVCTHVQTNIVSRLSDVEAYRERRVITVRLLLRTKVRHNAGGRGQTTSK